MEHGLIINLTQHESTPGQKTAGVVEPFRKERVQELLTFDELPHAYDIRCAAVRLAQIAVDHGADAAMIGGAPFLMPALAEALDDRGVTALFAFSTRESVETTLDDGSVTKQNVFRHKGFVEW